ncbi:MAG: hypothetical protein AAGF95_20320 [Chloroflexota bacterium]
MLMKRLRNPQTVAPFIFILPAITIMVVGLIIPVANAFYLSFLIGTWGLPGKQQSSWDLITIAAC